MPGGACAHDTTIKPGQPQPTNFHFHGMHVTPRNHTVGGVTYYGDNVLVCLPDGKAHIRFRIPPNPAPGPAIPAHEMGTYWYHAHLHGLTDDQVYRGLAGMLIVGDSRRYLPPRLRHVRSRILSLKDIQVTSVKGQQTIPTDHDWANPTHRTVNGLVNPTITIGPGETQLWRLADTSSALWYRVALIDAGKRIPFTIVGQDGNPLMRPDRKTEILLAPGNRFDILVRAPQSGGALLETLPFNQGRLIFGEDILATVKTTPGPIAPAIAPPAAAGTLSSFPSKRGPDRLFIFSTYFPKGEPGQFLINGKQFDPNRIDAAPRLGTWERWTLLNTSGEYHPFHIHQNDFRVISINGRRVPIRSDQDVVPIPPIDAKGVPGRVVIDMPFENFTGRFVFHCHILDHEDGGMMAQVEVRA
jgi:FtsP/CotA-like multicopper oxidase with cupredoxin domain